MADEITVKLSREEARAVAGHDYGPKPAADAHESGIAKIDASLAEHDAAQNPLGLPWCVQMVGDPKAGATWSVETSDGRMTQGRCYLMAAAPELADALEEIADATCPTGGDLRQKADAALRKAGRG